MTAFPGLTIRGTPAANSVVTLNFPKKNSDDTCVHASGVSADLIRPYYAYFINQLATTRVKIASNGQVRIPCVDAIRSTVSLTPRRKSVSGTVYVAVVDCDKVRTRDVSPELLTPLSTSSRRPRLSVSSSSVRLVFLGRH